MPRPRGSGIAAAAPAAPAARRGPARRLYQRLHPVTWLRWLRAGIVVMIAVTAVLGWVETAREHAEITVASTHGVRAVADVAAARRELLAASAAVNKSFRAGTVPIAGLGATYNAGIASSAQDLVLAADDNVAGTAGSDQIQFVSGELSSYRTQVDKAGNDAAAGDPVLASAELTYAGSELGVVSSDLQTLGTAELGAVNARLGSGWLAAAWLWLLLAVPLAAVLALAWWTCYVLLAGFRRVLSVRLVLAAAATAGFVATVGTANAHDSGHAARFVEQAIATLPRSPAGLAGPGPDVSIGSSAGVLVTGLVLAASAAVLAYASYYPRIAEYRKPPS